MGDLSREFDKATLSLTRAAAGWRLIAERKEPYEMTAQEVDNLATYLEAICRFVAEVRLYACPAPAIPEPTKRRLALATVDGEPVA